MSISRTLLVTFTLLACGIALTAATAPAATPKRGSVWSGATTQGTQSSVRFRVVRRGRHGRSVARFEAMQAALSCNYGGATQNVPLTGRVKVGRSGRFKQTRIYRRHDGTRVTFKLAGRFKTKHYAYGRFRIRTKRSPAECYTSTVDWTARSGG